jgi:hypothetical protein
MSTTVKIYVFQPQLDTPAQSRIRFPLWLKCLNIIAQMELITLDPLAAFYLVALGADWKMQPNPKHLGQRRVSPTPHHYYAHCLRSHCILWDYRRLLHRVEKI